MFAFGEQSNLFRIGGKVTVRILTFIEKQTVCRLFGISDGYIFKFWSDRGSYTKNITQQLILESCGIDIYRDKPYKDLSQQKCVEKIWNDSNPQTVVKLLSALSDYFCFAMGTDHWSGEDKYDYQQVQEIINRLTSSSAVSLPSQETADLRLILSDIDTNIQAGKPELVIDRLHTFATQYIREICRNHSIAIADEKGDYYSLDSLVAKLKGWYESENYFESEFCVVAIRNTINIFAKYNDLRNSKSAAHPNPLLKKAEAAYVVKVVAETLMFIDNIEKSKQNKLFLGENGELLANTDDELPF